MKLRFARVALASSLLAIAALAHAAPPASVYLEELTWTELRDRIAAGTTMALVPIGGTEQNGPHMVLGKHNVRVRVLAGRIAQRLGNAVVAPVLAYVPEGSITPPAAHMRFAGTLSIDEATFESLLVSTARSLCQHGLHDVVFLGDHGGYQKAMDKAAARVASRSPGSAPCRAHALGEYYQASQGPTLRELQAHGFSTKEIGTHAGLADTALALAVDPALVRSDALAAAGEQGASAGVYGDPRRATAEAGRAGAERIVDESVAAIRRRIGR